MKTIRAFVGHSFTDDDAGLVGKFTKFLDQLSELHPTFSWVHAEPAEPRELAHKVMSLIEGKNLFIGICTKKERVVAADDLHSTWLPRNHLRGREAAFNWKTSDWIIQEIGLAKGRNLDLLLLVEENLRQPGGLQGNIEYITFSREAPEKSFGKILEMLTALSPKIDLSAGAPPTTTSASEGGPPAEQTPAGDSWATPKADWDRSQYEFAFLHLVAKEDLSAASAVSTKYLESPHGQQPADRVSWEAYCEHVPIWLSKGGNLSKLKGLAEANPGNPDVLTYLARAHKVYDQYAVAAEILKRAASASADPSAKLRRLKEAALAHEKEGNERAVSAIVDEMKQIVAKNPSMQEELLSLERRLAEARNADEILVGVLERTLELNPSDNDARFALAYKYSEMDLDDLALLQYLNTPYGERGSMVWNNLGVAYDQLELPVKSVAAYRQAEAAGETLAMSNLANKLLRAGFLDEASKITEAALAIKDFHKNIAQTARLVKEAKEKEEEKEEGLLKKARPISEFYRKLGRAVAKSSPEKLGSQWRGPKCVLDIKWDGKTFHAVGTYERPYAGLRLLEVLGGASGAGGAKAREVIEYQATVRGRAMVGTVSRRSEGQKEGASTVLSQDNPRVLMVIAEDGKEIYVLERGKKDEADLYSFTLAVRE